MVDPRRSERADRSPAGGQRSDEVGGLDGVEFYEVDGATVFYDPRNPLAWVEASRTVTLADRR